eukprot:m.114684 g.114684  ORF g.114684 m.114684 type:complete len:586 (-) comp28365_c0_seq2:228-1985(-)
MEAQSLITGNGPVYTNYNRGPRKATDRWVGGVFVASLIAFIGWSLARMSGHMFFWEFHEDDFVVEGNSHCVKVPQTHHLDINITKQCADTVVELIAAPLGWGLVGSTLFGVLLVIGFKYRPLALSIVSIVGQVLVPAAIGVYWIKTSSMFFVCEEDDDCAAGGAGEDDEYLRYPAYFLFALSALLAFVYWYIRAAVKFVAEILRFSSDALGKNIWLLPVKLGFYFVYIIFSIGLWFTFVTYFIVGDVTFNSESFDCEFTFAYTTRSSTEIQIYCFFGTLVIGWFFFWGLETRNYVVADTMAHWYYHGVEDGGNISRACRHAFCSHFGSLTGAAFCMWLVESLKKRSRGGCGIFLMCILSYIEFLFKTGVVMMAITGDSFGNSGIEVGKLFWSSFGNADSTAVMWALPNRMMTSLAFVVSALWGTIYGLSSYSVVKVQCDANHLDCVKTSDMTCASLATIYACASGVGTFVICLITLHFLISVLLVIADTGFICFLMDKRDGVVTQPRIHTAFGDMITWRNSQTCCRPARVVRTPKYLAGIAPGYAATVPPTYQSTAISIQTIEVQQQRPPQYQPQQQYQQQHQQQ